NPAKASSISDCTPAARTTRNPGACSTRCSRSAVLPTPASPRTTSALLSPAPTASMSRSSTSRSLRRPVSDARRLTGESLAILLVNRRYTGADRLQRLAIGGCDCNPPLLILGGIPKGGRQNDHRRTAWALHDATSRGDARRNRRRP